MKNLFLLTKVFFRYQSIIRDQHLTSSEEFSEDWVKEMMQYKLPEVEEENISQSQQAENIDHLLNTDSGLYFITPKYVN